MAKDQITGGNKKKSFKTLILFQRFTIVPEFHEYLLDNIFNISIRSNIKP